MKITDLEKIKNNGYLYKTFNKMHFNRLTITCKYHDYNKNQRKKIPIGQALNDISYISKKLWDEYVKSKYDGGCFYFDDNDTFGTIKTRVKILNKYYYYIQGYNFYWSYSGNRNWNIFIKTFKELYYKITNFVYFKELKLKWSFEFTKKV
jgi:hypothetical protein